MPRPVTKYSILQPTATLGFYRIGLSRPPAFEVFRTPYHFRTVVSGTALCLVRDVDIAASERQDDLLLGKLEGARVRQRKCRTPENRAAALRALRQFANWVMWGKLPEESASPNPPRTGRKHCPERRPPRLPVPRLTRNHASAASRSLRNHSARSTPALLSPANLLMSVSRIMVVNVKTRRPSPINSGPALDPGPREVI